MSVQRTAFLFIILPTTQVTSSFLFNPSCPLIVHNRRVRLDHPVHRTKVVDIRHVLIVLVLQQLEREFGLGRIQPLPHHRQSQVFAPLLLDRPQYRSDTRAVVVGQLGEMMLYIFQKKKEMKEK